MTDQILIQKTIRLAKEERRIGIQILELLHEIERRKSYSQLGYDGLFSFCVKELRYSEAQAARRIQAMRAMHELPELKTKIESGELTVTTVAQVQTHLRLQKKTGIVSNRSEKMKLFNSMIHKSSKQVESQLDLLAGEIPTERLLLNLSPEMKKAWDSIKGLSAHSTRGDSEAILKMLMREWLDRHHPKVVGDSVTVTAPAEGSTAGGIEASATETTAALSKTNSDATHVKKEELRYEVPSLRTQRTPMENRSRYIPINLKRNVWKRDQRQCTNCSSRFALQVDHIVPFAKGGTHHLSNLRLLCRSCNIRHGIQQFGLQKMRRA